MLMFRLLFIFIFLFYFANSIVNDLKCGRSETNQKFSRLDIISNNQRLVGGYEAKPYSWPWTGQIKMNGRPKCGCTLIEQNVVITAAHCFAKSRKVLNYTVLLGGHKFMTGKEYSVSGIKIHPLYQMLESAYDLALVRIFPDVNINDKISLICLPSLPAPIYKMCVVSGWGRLKENGLRPKAMQEIHVPIIPLAICNNYKHYNGRIHIPSMICAGYNNGRIDSCQGDSGSPLQCQNANGIWELQGIVSWGIGCGNPEYPGVYTKIFSMVTWIRTQLAIAKNLPHLVF